MLTLEPMSKVRVVCLHKHVPRAIAALYEFGGIHITRSRHGTPDVPLPSFEKISQQLIALRAMENVLKISEVPLQRMPPDLDGLFEASDEMRSQFSKVEQAFSAMESLKAQAASLSEKRKALAPFKNLNVAPSVLGKTSRLSFEYRLLKVGEKEVRAALKGVAAQVSFARLDDKLFALFAYGVNGEAAAAAINQVSTDNLEIPKVDTASFAQAFEQLEKQVSQVESDKFKLAKVVEEFTKRNAAVISQLRADLEQHAKQAELPNKFGKTDFLELIEGWVPAKNSAKMQKQVSQATKGKVFIEDVKTQDVPPSKLDNPRGIRRFEFLVEFFSLPSSQELDPTLFIAITFPIIFGMIFGDVGYGLLVAGIGLFLRSKKGFMSSIGGMMVLSGACTVIFGFIFGEFFGGKEMLGYTLYQYLPREGHGIQTLFILTLVVGVLHLGLGLLIGLVTNLRAKHYDHALAKAAWLLVEAGMVGSIYSVLAKDSVFALPSLAVLLAGIVGLFKFEGVAGVVELPGLLSNGLSYLRIMALGLSGVILSLIVNQIPVRPSIDALLKAGSSGDAVGIITALLMTVIFGTILLLGHALALGLGIFESGIQGLRLHYVEFFSKFYHGGGIPFSPLREKQE